MKFKKFRKLCWKTEPVVIGFVNGNSEYYSSISDVPKKYNDIEVIGISSILMEGSNHFCIQRGLEICLKYPTDWLLSNNRKER